MRHSKFKVSKSSLLMALFCSSLALGGTITPAFSQTKYRPAPLTNAAKPAPSVLQALRKALVKQFGVQRFAVVSTSAQNWPDGCLGLAQANEVCTLAIVSGWRIEVTDGLQNWVYRSDRTGKVIRLENPDRALLPQAVARRLIRQVAKDTRISMAKLRIAEVKSKELGGCFGFYEADRACTAIAISGWQAIVTSPDQSFVYHLTKNGDRIAQNMTASGATRAVRVSFEIFGGEIPPLDNKIIFQSSSSGDLSGKMTRTELTSDGKITLYQSSPLARFAPVVIRTLSPGQIKAFKKLLEDSRFPNLDGLSYLTTAALADYPTTTYQGMFTAVQFIDLEKKNMPQALQKVIIGWEKLIQQ
jgi:hypothetical protein